MTPLIREAKNILMNYRSLTRLTGRYYSLDELYRVTPESFSIEATEPHDGDGNYLLYRLAMIQAWQTLDKREQEVLYYAYFDIESMRIRDIADKMGYSMKSIDKFKAQGSKKFQHEFKQRYKL